MTTALSRGTNVDFSEAESLIGNCGHRADGRVSVEVMWLHMSLFHSTLAQTDYFKVCLVKQSLISNVSDCQAANFGL